MAVWSINRRRDGFLRDGKPVFYLADTVWSAFSNTSLEEWEQYLSYRRHQPFNVLQISILPILHDTSDTNVNGCPFRQHSDGSWDFSRINEPFFERAEKMVRMAEDGGFTCLLVVLWANYVPDTFFSRNNPSHIMPLEFVKPYTEYVVRRFAAYSPVYAISGDTDFGSDRTVRHYLTSLQAVKDIAPDALTTLHLMGAAELNVEEFLRSDLLDFYMYQSSHDKDSQEGAYRLAQAFYAKREKRPVVNGEPCYEGHGHGNKYGRFDAFDVRKAFWWSVLSGAKAGFAYGAHGLFSWHRTGAAFTSEAWSKIPYDWRTALRMEGAWDASYCSWLFERYGLYDIEPAQDLLLTPYEQIRAAASPGRDRLAVYIPYSNELLLDADLRDFSVEMVELDGKRIWRPELEFADGRTRIRMHDFNADAVLFAARPPSGTE
ncbi:DUF4038 domain-containing protein [Cohnella zeiphila]|uniref:DUF4038 domain-containing protein n=1 Tax=Cohnella zeiphila TaxID=2761120 RepID=A0A7X0SUQ3_9BACL|nr:DUF4038 domain-containing protein [Cohnella zeiphila]MBB6735270.1 DUF4038 domain-containing protein [Cohnella zeiphila]